MRAALGMAPTWSVDPHLPHSRNEYKFRPTTTAADADHWHALEKAGHYWITGEQRAGSLYVIPATFCIISLMLMLVPPFLPIDPMLYRSRSGQIL
jgi:hypothetical protein